MNAKVNVFEILKFAGADPDAAPGRIDYELAQVAAVMRELVDSLPALIDIARNRAPVSLGVIRRTEAALARIGGAP